MPTQKPEISICIATYNMKYFLCHTITNLCVMLERCLCSNETEIIIYDDCSTDGTDKIEWFEDFSNIRYIRGNKNLGVGQAFNKAIKAARGNIIILMCADDLIISDSFFSDVKQAFLNPSIGHVSRWYYQFIDGKAAEPVRAWRTYNMYTQANNPSGLAFRKKALKGCSCSNKMFIETTQLVHQVSKKGWGSALLRYDAIAVRVHNSTSTQGKYWLKRRVSSPVVDQWNCGADTTRDFTSLIQIKVNYKLSAVFEEMVNFIKLRKTNIVNPGFWFFGILALLTPRIILRKIPHIYRMTWGRWTTKIVRKK